jgi:hypothetical protein
MNAVEKALLRRLVRDTDPVHAVIEPRATADKTSPLMICETLCGREYEGEWEEHGTPRKIRMVGKRRIIRAIKPIAVSEITCNSCAHVWRRITR